MGASSYKHRPAWQMHLYAYARHPYKDCLHTYISRMLTLDHTAVHFGTPVTKFCSVYPYLSQLEACAYTAVP